MSMRFGTQKPIMYDSNETEPKSFVFFAIHRFMSANVHRFFPLAMGQVMPDTHTSQNQNRAYIPQIDQAHFWNRNLDIDYTIIGYRNRCCQICSEVATHNRNSKVHTTLTLYGFIYGILTEEKYAKAKAWTIEHVWFTRCWHTTAKWWNGKHQFTPQEIITCPSISAKKFQRFLERFSVVVDKWNSIRGNKMRRHWN